jgi:thiol-disulfide isomerase/thioredoxin
MNPDRRDILGAGLALGLSAGSSAALAAQAWPPQAVLKQAAFKPWERKRNPVRAPFGGLGDWLEGRPTVLVLWATWCPPCMGEKAPEAAMQSKLIAAGSRTRIKSLQAYDDKTLAQGRALVTRVGGASLDLATASKPMEKAFLDVFGKSPVEPERTSLPAMLLLAPDGRELGRAIGTLPEGYWQSQAAFDFLSSLDKLVAA